MVTIMINKIKIDIENIKAELNREIDYGYNEIQEVDTWLTLYPSNESYSKLKYMNENYCKGDNYLMCFNNVVFNVYFSKEMCDGGFLLYCDEIITLKTSIPIDWESLKV
jgi:hypothetical protein